MAHFVTSGVEPDSDKSAIEASSGSARVRAVVLLLSSLLALSRGGFAMTPVIISTDIGNEIDDQWVVVYALTNPQVEVLGVISAHAPTVSPPAAHTTFRILVDVVEN